MPQRLPKFKLKTGIFAILAAVSLGGAAYFTLGPTRPIAKVVQPAASSSPAAEVAGASIAPTSIAAAGQTPAARPLHPPLPPSRHHPQAIIPPSLRHRPPYRCLSSTFR